MHFEPIIVLSAGMPRAASTLLFNMLRYVLRTHYGEELTWCWKNDFDQTPKRKMLLIKTHSVCDFQELEPREIFYSYRDVRTALVSMSKFAPTPTFNGYIDQWIEEYQQAKIKKAHFISYTTLKHTPTSAIQLISEILKIPVDTTKIWNEIEQERHTEKFEGNYSMNTLYHHGHITQTQDDEWRQVLPLDLQKRVNEQYRWWFQECGYPLE